MEEMKRQLEFATKQEQRSRKTLEETRRAKEGMKANFESQIQDLRQQKLKLETTLQDVKITSIYEKLGLTQLLSVYPCPTGSFHNIQH